MKKSKICMEIPQNINENSNDAISRMKEITKITNRCNQNFNQAIKSRPKEEEIEICNENLNDGCMRNFHKMIRTQKKFLKLFKASSLENVINIFSDLKCNEIRLKKKIKFVKEKYKEQIKNLQIQNDSYQKKIELLEKTVNSLHCENDKTILIIESLQNENVFLCEQSITEQLNTKDTIKNPPVTSNYYNIQNTFLSNQIQNLKMELQKQETENSNLKEENQKLNLEIQNLRKEYQKQEHENKNLKLKSQKQEIENENLRIEYQRNEDEVTNLNAQMQKLLSETYDLKNQIIQINNDKNREIQYIERYYSDNQKKDNDQLTRLLKKYKKQNEILRINKNTLETENKSLMASLDHMSVLKSALKNLKRQNFKLEIEVENLKMKNFRSPFKNDPQTPTNSSSSSNSNEMIDIGIITTFSDDDLVAIQKENEVSNYQNLYFIEKERRKILANLLSRIIRMFENKCNQFLYDFSILVSSQNAKIQNICNLVDDM